MGTGAAGRQLEGGALELLASVGAGGAGRVYRAVQVRLGRQVAVKLLLPEGQSAADWWDAARRLRDEAVASARVHHPALAEVVTAGEDPELGPWIAYEYLPGGTLRAALAASGPWGLERAVAELGLPLLDGLAALHGAGVVHRDVKPENVLRSAEGAWKLADFGLAVFEGREAKTQTGVMVGTPGYVAPERLNTPDAPPGPEGDVYGMAALLVEVATGRSPFRGANALGVVHDQLARDVRPSDLVALGLPEGAAAVLARSLARDPRRRHGSAAALAAALEGAVGGGSSAPADVATLVVPSRAVAAATAALGAVSRATASPRPRPAPFWTPRAVAALVALGVAVGALGAFALRGPASAVDAAPPVRALAELRERLLAAGDVPSAAEVGSLGSLARVQGVLQPPEAALCADDEAVGRWYLLHQASGRGLLVLAGRLGQELAGGAGLTSLAAAGVSVAGKFLELGRRAEVDVRSLRAGGGPESRGGPELDRRREELLSAARALGALAVRSPEVERPERARALDQALTCLALAATPAAHEAAAALATALASAGASDLDAVGALVRAAACVAYTGLPSDDEQALAQSLVARATDLCPPGDVDRRARLTCLRAAIEVRADQGGLLSRQGSGQRARALLGPLAGAGLRPETLALVRCTQAFVRATEYDAPRAEALLMGLAAEELPEAERWWFWRTWHEVHLIRGRIPESNEARRIAGQLAPVEYWDYLRGPR